MKTTLLLGMLVLFQAVATGKEPELKAFHHDPAPPASKLSQDMFWIADTRKMDRFLAQLDLTSLGTDHYAGEILPDTRVVWREYAREATEFAAKADDEGVNHRIGQMLKLAALYREMGGLQNVAQGEEIRALAGHTVQSWGYGGLIHSPYLEANVAEVEEALERKAGGDKGEVRPIFWQHMLETARTSFAHLTGRPLHPLAEAVSDERPR